MRVDAGTLQHSPFLQSLITHDIDRVRVKRVGHVRELCHVNDLAKVRRRLAPEPPPDKVAEPAHFGHAWSRYRFVTPVPQISSRPHQCPSTGVRLALLN